MAKQRTTLTKEEILQENATEFGKCFILETTAKLLFFNSILKGEVKKKGSFSKALIEKGGLLGGLLSICGIVPVGSEIASLINGLGMIAESVENKPYIQKNSNLGELIREILCNAKEFTETLASVSIDIFQCYEMQFTHATRNKNAMHILAKDAAERAFEHMIRTQRTSINQSILSVKGKNKDIFKQKYGYSIDFKLESSSFECRTSDLYEKPGIVKHSKGQIQFWKRNDGKSKPSKYGYRLLSCKEDWNNIEDQYEEDTEAKDKNKHFAQYEYLLNLGNIKEYILKNVIEKAKEEGALADERIMVTLQKTHKETTNLIQDLEKSVKDLAECSAEDRKLLKEIKRIVSHLNKEEYVTKIFESLEENIEKLRQESANQFIKAEDDQQNKATADERNRQTTHKYLSDNEERLCEKETPEEELQQELWFEVKRPVVTFIGREDIMAEIHDVMQKKIETSDKRFELSQIICISGLGGIGKTELARKYASKYGKAFDNNIIWVNAENTTSLRQSFLRFARVKLPKEIKKYEEMDTQNIVQEVYKEYNKRKCFFIFDNVESPSDFKEFRPHLPPGQRTPCILITSQNKEWGMTKVIELEGLTCEEAAGLIRYGLELGGNSGEQDIKCLADRLQCFPLALQQAVAYIKHKYDKKKKYSGSKFDIKDYLEMFDEQTKSLLDYKFPKDGMDDYTKTTFTTWKLTMDKIKDDEDYGRQSEELLNMLSYVYPDNIDMALFKGLDFPNDTLEEVGSLLERYCIIGSKVDCLFNIHRLVQNVVRINLKHERKEEEVLYKAVELFYDHIQHEKENDITWDYERIVHFISLWEYGIQYEEIAKSFSELPRWVLYKLISEGKFSEAVKISKISIEEWKKHAIINENTLHIMHWSTVYPDEPIETIKKIDDALEYHREFLEKLKTESNNDQIEIWSRVGSKEGYFKRTRDLLVKRKDCIGEIKNSDIKLYKDLLNDCNAIQLYKDFLKDCRATLGDNHSLTLYAMFSIADLLMKNEKSSEATTAYKEVFNKSREILGYEDWLTYDVMNTLAIIFKDNGKFDEAIEIYQEFVNGCKEVLGLDHENALIVNIKLADLLVRNKNIDEAITVYEELLNRRLKLDANGLTLIVLGKMAELLTKQGYLDKAIEAHKDLLKEHGGKDQKQTLKTLEVIGRLHKQAGNMSEALPVYYELLELQNGMSGYGNKLILPTMKNIETILIKMGRIEEAIQMYKEQLGHLEKTSSDIKSSLYIMNNIASLLEKIDKVQEAIEMYILLHKNETEMLGCKNVSFKSLAKIGELSKKIGSIDNAIKIYEDFLSECKQNLEPEDNKTWRAMEILANLLRDNGNIEEALGLYLELLSGKKGDALNDARLNSVLMANLTALTPSNLNLEEVRKVYEEFHIELRESLKQAEEETSAMDTISTLYSDDR